MYVPLTHDKHPQYAHNNNNNNNNANANTSPICPVRVQQQHS